METQSLEFHGRPVYEQTGVAPYDKKPNWDAKKVRQFVRPGSAAYGKYFGQSPKKAGENEYRNKDRRSVVDKECYGQQTYQGSCYQYVLIKNKYEY